MVLLLTPDLVGYKEKVIFLYLMEINKEEVRQHFACGESEDLTCDHFIKHIHLGRQLGGRQFEV